MEKAGPSPRTWALRRDQMPGAKVGLRAGMEELGSCWGCPARRELGTEEEVRALPVQGTICLKAPGKRMSLGGGGRKLLGGEEPVPGSALSETGSGKEEQPAS